MHSQILRPWLKTFLNFGHMRSLIAAAMVTVSWVYKSGVEEAFMRHHFGIEYDRYCHDVKRLIPGVW
jgi:protein-S-isoprenylcysteine O-methyltransferase Ste14